MKPFEERPIVADLHLPGVAAGESRPQTGGRSMVSLARGYILAGLSCPRAYARGWIIAPVGLFAALWTAEVILAWPGIRALGTGLFARPFDGSGGLSGIVRLAGWEVDCARLSGSGSDCRGWGWLLPAGVEISFVWL